MAAKEFNNRVNASSRETNNHVGLTSKDIKELQSDVVAMKTRSATWTVALGLGFTLLQIVIGAAEVWVLHK